MDIDQAGRDIEAGDVDHFGRGGGWQIRLHGRHSIAANGHVGHGIDAIARVDHVAAFEDQIIARILRQSERAEAEQAERQPHPVSAALRRRGP